MQEPKFQYKNYTYQPEYEVESDMGNAKIWHEIVTPEGKTISADFTPYYYMSKEDFIKFIDAGMPGRSSSGSVSVPLNSKSLNKIYSMNEFEKFLDSENQ